MRVALLYILLGVFGQSGRNKLNFIRKVGDHTPSKVSEDDGDIISFTFPLSSFVRISSTKQASQTLPSSLPSLSTISSLPEASNPPSKPTGVNAKADDDIVLLSPVPSPKRLEVTDASEPQSNSKTLTIFGLLGGKSFITIRCYIIFGIGNLDFP
jgi:hypothetical protein